jgi:flagellar biosynthesis chaperone FliJ
MKRYSFRLQTVLRVRRIQEEQAKTALLLANRALHDAEIERTARWNRYDSTTADTALCTVAEFEAGRFRWDMAAQSAILADHLRDARAFEVVTARHTWTAASQRVEILERLDERRRDEWQHEFDHDELVEVDDIVTGRYRRHREQHGGDRS